MTVREWPELDLDPMTEDECDARWGKHHRPAATRVLTGRVPTWLAACECGACDITDYPKPRGTREEALADADERLLGREHGPTHGPQD